MPLNDLNGWVRTEKSINHISGDYFSVMAVRVEAHDREVCSWHQPLISHPYTGIIGYLVSKINGVLHFLVQAKYEPGNFDLIEMAPTVSCSNPAREESDPGSVPFLSFFLRAKKDQIRYDTVLSEEGGRFFNVKNRYMIMETDKEEHPHIPDAYIWMTLRQILEFTKYSNYFNIEARSLLACLSIF